STRVLSCHRCCWSCCRVHIFPGYSSSSDKILEACGSNLTLSPCLRSSPVRGLNSKIPKQLTRRVRAGFFMARASVHEATGEGDVGAKYNRPHIGKRQDGRDRSTKPCASP